MNSIYDLIELISDRTAMYTGECKLSNVRAYLDGYSAAVDTADFLGDFPGFHDWVAKKYGFKESTTGWQSMILAIELGLIPNEFSWQGYSDKATDKNHQKSVSHFFQLTVEYRMA